MFLKNLLEDNWELFVELKNVIVIFLVLVDFIFLIILTFFDISQYQLISIVYFDLFVCLILFIQLCYDYKHYEHGFKSFLKENFVDIISVIPLNFIFFRYLAVSRIFRLLQALQVLKIFNIKRNMSGSFKFFIQNRLLKILAIILFMYLFFSAVVLKNIDPSFSSVYEAFWFNIVTITSVGYGDVTPLTDSGKLIAMCSIILGIGFVSIFTAATSAIYMEKPEKETRYKIAKHFTNHHEHLKQENEKLNERLNILEKQNEELNEKLDEVIKLLEDKE